MLPDLAPDALYVFAFGPGFGELVAVRAPPNHWLVVDGCSADGVGYGTKLLEHYDVRPSIVVLTHPHLDHARGLGDVIDAATSGPSSDWPTIGLVLPTFLRGAGDLGDLPAAYQGGVAEEAVSAVLDRWERKPACRWDLHLGDVRPLGEAEVRVAAPSRAVRADADRRWSAGRAINPNKLATVLLVTWQNYRIVLGSDLVDDPPEGWSAAIANVPQIAAPHVLKVAHHGSLPAQYRPLFAPDGTTVLVATPFSKSRLPQFKDGDGAEFLLDRSPELLLTGLPRAHGEQGVNPQRATRAELHAAGPNGPRAPALDGFPDCACVIEVRSDGAVRKIMGPGSVVVTP